MLIITMMSKQPQCFGVAGTSQMLFAAAGSEGRASGAEILLTRSLCAVLVGATDIRSACGPGFAIVVPNGMMPVLLHTGNLASLGDLGTLGATLA